MPALIVLAVAALLWEVGARLSDSPLIATFGGTVAGVWELTVVTGQIWGPLLQSNQSVAIGYAIAVVLAVPLGLLMGRAQLMDRVLDPYVVILLVVPMAPLLPIIVMMLGIGLSAAVLVVVAFALVYIVMNTRAGIRSIDPALIEMARSMGASERHIWTLILIPWALPAIATGLRIGLARSFAGMLLGELLLLARGVGLLIQQFRASFEAELVFATILILMLEALLLSGLMGLVESRIRHGVS